MKRIDWMRWGGIALIIILAGIFSWLNSGEAVALHFGLFVVYQIPVVTIFYVAFLLGMFTMFLLGLRHDVEIRRALRERGLLGAGPEAIPAAPPVEAAAAEHPETEEERPPPPPDIPV